MPVAGKVDDAGCLRADRIGEANRPILQPDLAARGFQPGERAQEFALAVPFYTGKANHLARPDIEVYPLQHASRNLSRNENRWRALHRLPLGRKGTVDRAAD